MINQIYKILILIFYLSWIGQLMTLSSLEHMEIKRKQMRLGTEKKQRAMRDREGSTIQQINKVIWMNGEQW